MITIWADTLSEYRNKSACLDLRFYRWDNGDAYTQVIVQEDARGVVPGILYINQDEKIEDISKIDVDREQVIVISNLNQKASSDKKEKSDAECEWTVKGFILQDGQWQEVPVQVIPLREDLFSRTRGILPAEVISDACVFVAGLGSVGSFLVELLAMSGIMKFILCDFQIVDIANICRQNAGISDIGRYKTKVAAQKILSKNPYAKVETHELKIAWESENLIRGFVRRSEVVIGPVDNRAARVILNKLCVEENKPLLLMGARHMAHCLQILFTRRPRIDPCYICFLMSLPKDTSEYGFSSIEQNPLRPYADHPVDIIEPALSVDIAPMTVMSAKVCLTFLHRDKPTGLQSLNEDLVAPLYIYINRREAGTKYEKLEPLGFNAGNGKTHILSWQGVDLKRNLACPVCGYYVREMSKACGISISQQDVERY